ncbi:MAG: c-type cytochrome [Gemmatimonadota bacterium]
MKRTAGVFWLAAVLILVAAQPTNAQTNGASDKTIWSGVYTEEQAERGEATVQLECSACHSPAEWSHARFLLVWTGRSIRDLHNQIRSTMPFDSPGRLSTQEYSDIVAYMLQLNDVPAGDTELPADDEGLSAIGVTPPASR